MSNIQGKVILKSFDYNENTLNKMHVKGRCVEKRIVVDGDKVNYTIKQIIQRGSEIGNMFFYSTKYKENGTRRH